LELEIFNFVISSAKVSIKDLTINFPHFEGQIQVDITPTCIKVQDLDIACETLHEDRLVRLLNKGTTDNL
jgi:hypothetical protein